MMTRRSFFGLSVLVPGAAVMPAKIEIPDDVRTVEVRPDRAYVFLVNRYSQVDAEALAKTVASLGVRGAVVLSDGQDDDVRFIEMEVPAAS